MKPRMIHAKRLDSITTVEFSYNDLTIIQDGAIVVLDKDQLLHLAQLIQNERNDQKFYETLKKGEFISSKSLATH